MRYLLDRLLQRILVSYTHNKIDLLFTNAEICLFQTFGLWLCRKLLFKPSGERHTRKVHKAAKEIRSPKNKGKDNHGRQKPAYEEAEGIFSSSA